MTRIRERSHVFLARDGKILALRQAHGRRWWEFPGGDREPGEAPDTTAVREVFEETALCILEPELLRTWAYQNTRGELVTSHVWAVEAPPGPVLLSDEHTDYAWMTVDEYAERYCSEELSARVPEYAAFLAGMRDNCALFRAWEQGRRC